jgi:hypothetical protein
LGIVADNSVIDKMDNPQEVQQVPRTRVNGSLLFSYHDKSVCLVGTVIKGDAGTAFSVRSSDGQTINVRLKEPLTEPVAGLVEVYGIGQGKNLIRADGFTVFPDMIAQSFDMSAYNDMITLLQTIPNAWVNSS